MSIGYGLWIFSAATGFSKLSIQLPEASVGATVMFDCDALVGDANLSVLASAAGGSAGMYDRYSTELSSINISAVGGLTKLTCFVAGYWHIVEVGSGVTEIAL